MSVRLERKTEHAEVGDKKHQGDRQGKPLLHYRAPATWAALGGHVKDRRNDQRDRREGEGDRRGARASSVKPLLAVFCAAAQDRQAEHEQMLPIIEPVIDALTTLVRPFESAMTAMISSAAFPNVAFKKPPAPSPIRAANISVARPIHPASGIMPMAEQMKSAVGYSAPGQNRNAIAIGTIKRSQESDGFKFTMNTGWIADTKFGLGTPPADAV